MAAGEHIAVLPCTYLPVSSPAGCTEDPWPSPNPLTIKSHAGLSLRPTSDFPDFSLLPSPIPLIYYTSQLGCFSARGRLLALTGFGLPPGTIWVLGFGFLLTSFRRDVLLCHLHKLTLTSTSNRRLEPFLDRTWSIYLIEFHFVSGNNWRYPFAMHICFSWTS